MTPHEPTRTESNPRTEADSGNGRNILKLLRARFARVAPEGADPDEFASAVRPGNTPRFGDYQANGCMAVAKARGINPRELAARVAARVQLAPLAVKPPEVAGPGFVNVELDDAWLARQVRNRLREGVLLDPPEQPRTIVVDYSSPNVAKPMHVGHLRSTVIGDALARIHAALGHKVVRDNHLGDWGAQFGMILWGWKNLRHPDDPRDETVAELADLYRAVRDRVKPAEEYGRALDKIEALLRDGKTDEARQLQTKLLGNDAPPLDELRAKVADARAVEAAARRETLLLHSGDPENRRLWNRFMPRCQAALDAVYRRLGVAFDVQLGESFYDPMLPEVVRSLLDAGLAAPSDGALVVDVPGLPAPFLVRKSDGAYNYATTDLATVKYRAEVYDPDLVLYVVDDRQSDHFRALFDVAARWPAAASPSGKRARLVHVAFGKILGPDKRPYKTREGDVVGLESLLDEAVARARRVVDENSPDLSDADKADVAEIVGIGAVKYADLSQNRASDYVFDWAKMMAMNGNTATYLQYAYARVRAIFRRGETTPAEVLARDPEILLDHPAERALALLLLRYPEAVEAAAAEFKPNLLADHLYSVATAFSKFFEECPVLKAESPARRDSRLALCELVARVVRHGLDLLGIKTAERL